MQRRASGVAEAVQRVLAAVGDSSALSAHTLGAAYEAELALDRRGRQQAAVFYTPSHIVDFVVDIGLVPSLAERSRDDILELRVTDPACGSGVFLVAALEAIERALVGRGATPCSELRAEIAERCLRGVDVDPVAVELCRLALTAAIGAPCRAELVCADSLEVEHRQCDVLLTNPPWGQKNLHFDAEAKARLRQRFATARGVLDPFKLFVELAQRTVVPGGRWAMVLPDIILLKNHEQTRRMILEDASLEWVVHVGRAFERVNLDACVIAACVGSPATNHQVSTAVEFPGDWPATKVAARSRAQNVFRELPGAKLNIVASDHDLERVERLRHLPRVGDVFEIHEGVHSGNRRAALFVRQPMAPCAPLIVGGAEAEPFRLRWDGGFIRLDPAAVGRDKGGYANLGRYEWHLRKKIVVRRTGDQMIVGFDRIGRFVSNNFFVVVPRHQMSSHRQRAIVAVLGSAFMTWYFRTVQPRAGRLFAELKINQLADFPLVPMSRGEESSLAALIERLEQDGLSVAARQNLTASVNRQVAAAYARILG